MKIKKKILALICVSVLGISVLTATLTAALVNKNSGVTVSPQNALATMMASAFAGGKPDTVLQVEKCIAGFINCKKLGEVGDLDRITKPTCEAIKSVALTSGMLKDVPWYGTVKVECVDWAPVYGATHSLNGKAW
jgi:hypothetical protein